MWIYGIRLFLIDSIKEAKPSAFNPDIIQTFLSNCNGKKSQGAEMAMKLLGCYNKEIVNKEPLCQKKLDFFASNSEFSKSKNGIGRSDYEEDCLNCEDNDEKSNSIECKSEIKKKDNENECSNCEDYKKLDENIVTCINSEMESKKETKSGVFNYKNFIQTFLSNSNGNVSQETEMVLKMLGYYDKQKIVNNDELYQGNLKTLTSTLVNSEYLGYKSTNGKDNSEKECSNHRGKHERSNSFESRNIRRANKKDYPNCSEDKKFDIDIKTYIDNKFYDMENKLMQRIEEMEVSTNKKLNAILERLETLKLM